MAGNVRQPIDIQALEEYIEKHITKIKTPFDLKQFGFGQSNPTYQITDASGRRYVLRKKPPGKLVSKTAHKVEREYRIIHALQNTDVPVPEAVHLCEDSNIIGTPFYIMSFLDGRIVEDASFPDVTATERQEMWHDAVRTLAKLHRLNPSFLGLATFGKPTGFYDRQIATFQGLSSAQAKVEDRETGQPFGEIPKMSEMLDFFKNHETQPQDRGTLIHGDYKIDNLVYHQTEPRVIGILDWEMSTIGHPLSDFVNMVTPWTLSNNKFNIRASANPAFERETAGLPTLDQCIAWYCEVAGWSPKPELDWAAAFWAFRTSVVLQGIGARYAARQASGPLAQFYGTQMQPHVQLAIYLIETAKRRRSEIAEDRKVLAKL